MKLRTRTSEKVVYLEQDSELEDDFNELKSRKSSSKEPKSELKALELNEKSKEIKKSKKKDHKKSEYFENDEIEEPKKKKSVKKKKESKKKESDLPIPEKIDKEEESMAIEDVKSELEKIDNVENKIDLLLKIESTQKQVKKKNDEISEMSDSEDDFEEVEMDQNLSMAKVKMDKDEIQVTIGDKKLKKPVDLQARMERMFKNMQKKFSVAMLKTHLLCWIAHGFYLNKLTRNPFIRAIIMSIDNSNTFQLINLNKQTVKNLIQNINSIFDLKSSDEFSKCGDFKQTIQLLGQAIKAQKCTNYLQYLIILIIFLRNLGIKTRLCVCFDVLTVNQKAEKKKVKKEESDSESDEEEKPKKLIKNKKFEKNNLILSMDESKTVDSEHKLRSTNDRNYWLEVYLEEEKNWCSIEPVSLQFDCSSDLEKRFDKRVLYVLAYDNDNRVKDVTKRYSSDWCIQTRLLRVSHLDDKKLWWEKTLIHHQPYDKELDMEEEKHLKEMLLKKPIPQSVSEFKDHPLYVLSRHLLKFQSIYPQDAIPLSHFRNEPVFSRDNLVTLCSKQTWLKYAREVKQFEKPSKIVKGRLKRSEYKAGCRENPDLDLYGFWQTKKYEPQYARNGIVPRNEFGNVELFQPCMLPHGCVHLRNMPNLMKVCRKLKIDCAAAVVGFDAHGGFSHAVYDGWIVCEEFKDVVVDAYLEEEREANLKLIQKKQERVINNWKRLVKVLLIRENLKLKYGEEKPVPKKKNLNKLIESSRQKETTDYHDDFIEVDKVGAKLNYLNGEEEKIVEEKIDLGEKQENKVLVVKLNRKAKTNKKTTKRKRKQKEDYESTESEDHSVTESESEEEKRSKKKKTTKPITRRSTRSNPKDKKEQGVQVDEESQKPSLKSNDIDDDNGFKLSESDSE